MRKYIREKFGNIGLTLVQNFSLISYIQGNGNLLDGGPSEAWMSTFELGSEKLGGITLLIQGGTFAQSVALTSEALGLGGSATSGSFVTGTLMKGAGHGIEKGAKRIAIPAAVVSTSINAAAREHCGCGSGGQ